MHSKLYFDKISNTMITLLNTIQITFIVVIAVIVVALLVVLAVFLYKRSKKNKYKEFCYKTVRKIADYQDYYLINEFEFNVDDNHYGMIDHVLFGDKYIYLITSNYYHGSLTGNAQDKSLILVPKKDKKQYVKNPFKMSEKLLTRLSMVTDLDPSLLIGIIATNDDINIDVENDSKQYYIIQQNKLSALIKMIESRDIPTINEKSLEGVVKAFDKIKQRRRKKKHEEQSATH